VRPAHPTKREKVQYGTDMNLLAARDLLVIRSSSRARWNPMCLDLGRVPAIASLPRARQLPTGVLSSRQREPIQLLSLQ
jgi:hypothetical protein